ncbi:hypothetical protein CI102_5247 [Trichoderma harzianum]|nr:hypothetical protein CI102_5247 [Trichoderma harzianum]
MSNPSCHSIGARRIGQFVLIHLVTGVTIEGNSTTESERLFDGEATSLPITIPIIRNSRHCKSPFPLFLHCVPLLSLLISIVMYNFSMTHHLIPRLTVLQLRTP